MISQTMRPIALLIFLLLFVMQCAKNPVTGKRQLVLVSEGQEIAMGRDSHPAVLSEFGEVQSEDLQSYVGRLGQELAAVSHRPALEWHFKVVDAPVVNAFALPGGYIYVTREILAYMNSEAELVGVLGHEIGHVTARHGVEQASRAQLLGLGIGLGAVFSDTFRSMSDLAQMGASLLFLKHGRDAERQADQLGVEYMVSLRYDARELSHFFQVFEQMREESGQVLPNWLSSHPAPQDRIAATRRMADELMTPGSDYEVRSREYVQHLDGLVFGENPREGYTRDGRFLHPDLEFQITYPPSWRIQNTKNAVIFSEPNGQAGAQLSLASGSSPEEHARKLADQEGVELVEGGLRRIHGNSSFVALYQLSGPGGSQRVMAAFVSYRNRLYQFVGGAADFQSQSAKLEGVLTSFRALKDRSLMSVQPDRVRLHTARRGDSLRSLSRRYPNPRVDLDALVALNRRGPDEAIRAGTPVKVVRAGVR